MSITLKNGGVTATTGGTDQTFVRTNTPVTNGYEYADVSEPNFFLRQRIVVTTRMPQLQSDGTYSKAKASMRWIYPKLRADGSYANNVARVEVEYDPETNATELTELREFAAQFSKMTWATDVIQAGTLPS